MVNQSLDMNSGNMLYWFSFLFDRYDGFRLLLCCAEGSSKSNFRDEWVEMMTDCSHEYYEEAYRRKLAKNVITKEEMHILLGAFWTTIFEPFIHEYTWEQILLHCDLVCKMMNWYPVLGFDAL